MGSCGLSMKGFAKNLIAEKSSANTRQAYRLKQDTAM